MYSTRRYIYNSKCVQTKKKYRYLIDFYFFDFKPTITPINLYLFRGMSILFYPLCRYAKNQRVRYYV